MTDNQKQQILSGRSAGLSYSQIAENIGISMNTVKSFCFRNGQKKAVKAKPQTRSCAFCGNEIKSKTKTKPKKFCSDKCRASWWSAHPEHLRPGKARAVDCACCGVTFHASVSTNRKYCSHECYINARFKGGDAA